MRYHSNMALILEGEMPGRRGTEAVPSCTKAGNTLSLESCNYPVDSGYPGLGTMFSNPCLTVECGGVEVNNGVIVQNVGSNGLVAIPREVVDQELYVE